MTDGFMARLQADVQERAQRQAEAPKREETRAAIEAARRGEEPSILDLDPEDPVVAKMYRAFLSDYDDEIARQRRATAAILTRIWRKRYVGR